MDDLDNINSKTDSDLRQIAVAFGDFSPEEAQKKTREELILAITGAKDIGDVTVVDLSADPVPVKPVSIPEPAKSAENNISLDELIENVGRTARFETNDLADKLIKAEKDEEKKLAKKETAENAKTEELKNDSAAAVSEEPKEEKKPVKRSAGRKKKSRDAEAETESTEDTSTDTTESTDTDAEE